MVNEIELLSQETIDKIAAGEVVERPASVVKELVENSIDANATAITIEMKDGGITLLRITDNGIGIPHNDIQKAFLRHTTSKIKSVEDLNGIRSLGFRGEALSSIAAVSRVELITKTKEDFIGSNYLIEGGREIELREIGAPEGTTIFVRQIFYNTPARKKFLKSPMTEGNYITDVVEKLAISHPGISFRLLANGIEKFLTSGNGNLKDVIYQIYGREITKELIEVNEETKHFFIHGYIGSPLVNRGNRSYESMFVDGRYVKSQMLMRALEYGYESFLMQHQYPFAVLNMDFAGYEVDVNVHPTKQEVRFQNNDEIGRDLSALVHEKLMHREDISVVPLVQEAKASEEEIRPKTAEPFEEARLSQATSSLTEKINRDLLASEEAAFSSGEMYRKESETGAGFSTGVYPGEAFSSGAAAGFDTSQAPLERTVTYEQQVFLSEESIKRHRIIGQIFDTYWMVEFDDSLYIIDQHAAHEKVLFERTMEKLKTKEMTSQQISPPIILSLSPSDMEALFSHREEFARVGYEFSSFGGNEVALTAIPDNIYGIDPKELFLNTVAGLSELRGQTSDLVLEKVASMSCKAAVKGHDHLSRLEAETLIKDLLSLENPYHCPHGRPTIVKMTHYELDKKFKRIV